jgi:methylase of polypeptide subunit release factors
LAAEVLYGKVGELAAIDGDTGTVLDVCCGTGTIGLSIAKVYYIYINIFLIISKPFF